MSTISVLAFPATTSDLTSYSSSDSLDSDATFASYDWALQVESPQTRWYKFDKPYSVIYTQHNPDPVPIFSYPHQPVLKVHIATAKHSRLLNDISRVLKDIPANTASDFWLDAALVALQSKYIVQRFTIDKFHQFVLDSLSRLPSASYRRMSSGTTELDYLSMLGNSAEVKKMLAPIHGYGGTATNGNGMAENAAAVISICGFLGYLRLLISH